MTRPCDYESSALLFFCLVQLAVAASVDFIFLLLLYKETVLRKERWYGARLYDMSMNVILSALRTKLCGRKASY